MRAPLPTRTTTAATAQLALERSTLKNGNATSRIIAVRTMAWSTPNTAVPMRCAGRGTGAISVCSIVPSHRSHVITRLMSSRIADR